MRAPPIAGHTGGGVRTPAGVGRCAAVRLVPMWRPNILSPPDGKSRTGMRAAEVFEDARRPPSQQVPAAARDRSTRRRHDRTSALLLGDVALASTPVHEVKPPVVITGPGRSVSPTCSRSSRVGVGSTCCPMDRPRCRLQVLRGLPRCRRPRCRCTRALQPAGSRPRRQRPARESLSLLGLQGLQEDEVLPLRTRLVVGSVRHRGGSVRIGASCAGRPLIRHGRAERAAA